LPIVAALYFVSGKFGLTLAFVNPSATPVWPPTGISLAALLLLGLRAWPAVFAGAFLVNVTTTGSVLTSLGIASGNTLEGLVGAVLVTRFAHGHRVFEQAFDIFKFAGLAGVLSPTVSATIGITSLALGGYAEWGRIGAIWTTWWLGDMVGAFVVTPLLVVWCTTPLPRPNRTHACELLLLLLVVILVGRTVFDGLLSSVIRNAPLDFLCVPLLGWAAFRFGQRETATVVAILSAIAIRGTLRGFGPFVVSTQNESLLLLQAFMGIMAISAFPLAAVVAQRRWAEGQLARIAAIVECSDDAIISKTLDGVITSWNRAAERLYGYSATEALGQPITIIIPPELPSEFPKILGRLRAGERVDHYETVRVRKDGTRFAASVTVSPILDSEGRVVAASGITRDMTERNQMAAALSERDKLRTVASLASAAAHEINNPLAVILGQIELLAKEVTPDQRRRTNY
jgi:PAS domain S-box-containing protein